MICTYWVTRPKNVMLWVGKWFLSQSNIGLWMKIGPILTSSFWWLTSQKELDLGPQTKTRYYSHWECYKGSEDETLTEPPRKMYLSSYREGILGNAKLFEEVCWNFLIKQQLDTSALMRLACLAQLHLLMND